MVTTVEAIQSLYVSIGGTLSDVENLNTIPDMITAISEFEAWKTEEERTVTSDEINAIVNSIS